jgi:hypothetical protein
MTDITTTKRVQISRTACDYQTDHDRISAGKALQGRTIDGNTAGSKVSNDKSKCSINDCRASNNSPITSKAEVVR